MFIAKSKAALGDLFEEAMSKLGDSPAPGRHTVDFSGRTTGRQMGDPSTAGYMQSLSKLELTINSSGQISIVL